MKLKLKYIAVAIFWNMLAGSLCAQLPGVLPPLDSLPEAEVNRYLAQMDLVAQTLYEAKDAVWNNATATRERAETAWKLAKQDTTTDKSTLSSLEKAFKTAQGEQKEADRARKQTAKIRENVGRLLSADLATRRKDAPKLWAQLQKASGAGSEPTAKAEDEKPARTKKPRKAPEEGATPEKPVSEIISVAEKNAATGAAPEDSLKQKGRAKKPKKMPRDTTAAAAKDTSAVAASGGAKLKLKKPKKAPRDTTAAAVNDTTAVADSGGAKLKLKKPKKTPRDSTAAPAAGDTAAVAVKSRPAKRVKKEPAVQADSVATGTAEAATKRIPPLSRYKAYSAAEDVMLAPPVPPCSLSLDTRDEFSGELQRETARAELFRHTNPALKNIIKGKSHVVCEASIGHAGAQAYLYLTFTVNDPNAPRTLGSLPKNGLAIVKLLSGGILNLYNMRADDGVAGPDNQFWVFRGQYPIDKATLKSLRTEPLDKIRLAWANGYEDYEVYNIRLLMRQAACLWE